MSDEEIVPVLGACLSGDPIRDFHSLMWPDTYKWDARREVPGPVLGHPSHPSMSHRPGRAGSQPDNFSLKYICTLSKKNAAISGNFSNCLTSLYSS